MSVHIRVTTTFELGQDETLQSALDRQLAAARHDLHQRLGAMWCPNESMRPLFAPEPMVLEEGTPGALAAFSARLVADGFGAPLHPAWHPSHREIL